jgi:hypothetical protein
MSEKPEAPHPLDQLSTVRPPPCVVETARKRALLLTEIVSYLARCRIALAALAEFERRQGNTDRASEVEHVYLSLNDIRQRFGLDVDDAHTHWRNLSCKGESGKCRPHD